MIPIFSLMNISNFSHLSYGKERALMSFVLTLWLMRFIFDCQHFVIASMSCDWYFERKKNQRFIVAYKRLIFYHLGSVFMGSLIRNVFGIVRFKIGVMTVSLYLDVPSIQTYIFNRASGEPSTQLSWKQSEEAITLLLLARHKTTWMLAGHLRNSQTIV